MMKIGILGGIGPRTTSAFYSEIINKLFSDERIDNNTLLPQIIINSVPAKELTEPNISDDDLFWYQKGIQELAENNPDFIVMACNTIHLYQEKLKEKSNFDKILSIRDIVHKALTPRKEKVFCVVGTPLTVQEKLYFYDDFKYKIIPEPDLQAIGEIIKQYSATNNFGAAQQRLVDLLNPLTEQVDCFILACTEISLLLRDTNLTFIDTMSILMDEVVRLVLKKC